MVKVFVWEMLAEPMLTVTVKVSSVSVSGAVNVPSFASTSVLLEAITDSRAPKAFRLEIEIAEDGIGEGDAVCHQLRRQLVREARAPDAEAVPVHRREGVGDLLALDALDLLFHQNAAEGALAHRARW